MDEVIEGLYIGGVMAALNEKELEAHRITHILSVDDKPLPEAYTSKFSYKHVFALDLYDSDLLGLLPECLRFIDQALEGDCRVLVHCQAGASRSATVVIAYLMQKLKLSKQEAINKVVAVRSIIRPNDGFQEQLQLFENMGSCVDKNNSEYRGYLLNRIAVKLKCGQFPGGVPDSEIPAEVFVDPDFSAKGVAAFFKCRKCRLFLFHSGIVTQHNVGEGESAFDWRSKVPASRRNWGVEGGGGDVVDNFCTRSLFVEPLTWMRGKIHEVQGKLHCPKCDIKIGSYVWYGEKCPCGAWVAPAFHIDNGKVDKIPSLPVLPSSRQGSHPISSSRSSGATAVVDGSMSPAGRPQNYVPLPERSPSVASTSSTPVAAVQPSISRSPVGISSSFPSSSVGSPGGISRASVSVTPIQAQDYEMGEGESRRNASDLETGINSIHMDVDS